MRFSNSQVQYASEYSVVGFDSVICENKNETRNLVTDFVVDPLMTLIEDVAGSTVKD